MKVAKRDKRKKGIWGQQSATKNMRHSKKGRGPCKKHRKLPRMRKSQ